MASYANPPLAESATKGAAQENDPHKHPPSSITQNSTIFINS